jgi:flagellin-like protein
MNRKKGLSEIMATVILVVIAIVVAVAVAWFMGSQPRYAQLQILEASYTVNSSIYHLAIINNGTAQAFNMTVDIRLMGVTEIPPIEPGEIRYLEWEREIIPPIGSGIFPIEESLIFTFSYERRKGEIVNVGPIPLYFNITEGS